MGGAWWLGVRVPRAFFVFQFIRGHGNWTGDGGRVTMGSHLTIQQMTHCFHSGGFSFLANREMVAMMKAQACGLESLELGNASAIGVLLLITVFMVRAWGIGQPECRERQRGQSMVSCSFPERNGGRSSEVISCQLSVDGSSAIRDLRCATKEPKEQGIFIHRFHRFPQMGKGGAEDRRRKAEDGRQRNG